MKPTKKKTVVVKPSTFNRLTVFAFKRGMKKQAVADKSVNLGLDEMERCP